MSTGHCLGRCRNAIKWQAPDIIESWLTGPWLCSVADLIIKKIALWPITTVISYVILQFLIDSQHATTVSFAFYWASQDPCDCHYQKFPCNTDNCNDHVDHELHKPLISYNWPIWPTETNLHCGMFATRITIAGEPVVIITLCFSTSYAVCRRRSEAGDIFKGAASHEQVVSHQLHLCIAVLTDIVFQSHYMKSIISSRAYMENNMIPLV